MNLKKKERKYAWGSFSVTRQRVMKNVARRRDTD
tara:strand:- start:108 stop:209 length:102 start_codon:yes stop_codon:yes gene_type:complete